MACQGKNPQEAEDEREGERDQEGVALSITLA